MDLLEQGDVGKEKWIFTLYMQKPYRWAYNTPGAVSALYCTPATTPLQCRSVCSVTGTYLQTETETKYQHCINCLGRLTADGPGAPEFGIAGKAKRDMDGLRVVSD